MGWKERKKYGSQLLYYIVELFRAVKRSPSGALQTVVQFKWARRTWKSARRRRSEKKAARSAFHYFTNRFVRSGLATNTQNTTQKTQRVNKKKFSWSKSKDYLVCSILCCVFTGGEKKKSRETVINLKCFNFTFFVRCDTESVIIQMRSRLVSWKFNKIR